MSDELNKIGIAYIAFGVKMALAKIPDGLEHLLTGFGIGEVEFIEMAIQHVHLLTAAFAEYEDEYEGVFAYKVAQVFGEEFAIALLNGDLTDPKELAESIVKRVCGPKDAPVLDLVGKITKLTDIVSKLDFILTIEYNHLVGMWGLRIAKRGVVEHLGVSHSRTLENAISSVLTYYSESKSITPLAEVKSPTDEQRYVELLKSMGAPAEGGGFNSTDESHVIVSAGTFIDDSGVDTRRGGAAIIHAWFAKDGSFLRFEVVPHFTVKTKRPANPIAPVAALHKFGRVASIAKVLLLELDIKFKPIAGSTVQWEIVAKSHYPVRSWAGGHTYTTMDGALDGFLEHYTEERIAQYLDD